MARALVIAAALALAACNPSSSDCRRTVHVAFDFDPATAAADTLQVVVGQFEASTHTLTRTAGSARDTLDIKLSAVQLEVTSSLPVTVQASRGAPATAGYQLLGSGTATIDTTDPSCVTHEIGVPATVPGAVGPCGCATGPCAGSCAPGGNGCIYTATSCTACIHGYYDENGVCNEGVCNLSVAPSSCPNLICGDSACGTLSAGARTVATGQDFSCATLTGNDAVRCWGSNQYGILGSDASVASSYAPRRVAGTSGLDDLVAGADHACGVLNGEVVCWGRNQLGQLGLPPDDLPHPLPTVVAGLPALSSTGTLLLTAAGNHTCAAFNGSAILCWGQNSSGELNGLPPATGTPTSINFSALAPPGTVVEGLALGEHHLCIGMLVQGQSQVMCLGADDKSQLGPGAPHQTFTLGLQHPVLVAGGDTTCGYVSASDSFSGPGSLVCWGSNADGQLGLGASVPSTGTPTSLCMSTHCATLTNVSVGEHHLCAGFDDGLFCWGSNSGGQLGTLGGNVTSGPGTTSAMATLPKVHGYVSAGFSHSCAVGAFSSADVAVLCWGSDQLGQTGQPITSMPTQPSPPAWAN